MTVDVEDYFHVSAFAKNIQPENWDQYELRVEDNTRRLLDLFAQNDVRATFFVLGWVAARCPTLIRKVAEDGHEIACHGYSHQLIYNQSKQQFRDETKTAKSILEDIVGQKVLGYRAASYSITKSSLWALDVLAESGFSYDSSIFPIHHDVYGIPDSNPLPHKICLQSGLEIAEFPISTLRIGGIQLPVAGGGYFRLFPYNFSRYALSRINAGGDPFTFYMHPWEIDTNQPRIRTNLLSSFRHYNNIRKFEPRMRKLISHFSFGTMRQILEAQGLVS